MKKSFLFSMLFLMFLTSCENSVLNSITPIPTLTSVPTLFLTIPPILIETEPPTLLVTDYVDFINIISHDEFEKKCIDEEAWNFMINTRSHGNEPFKPPEGNCPWETTMGELKQKDGVIYFDYDNRESSQTYNLVLIHDPLDEDKKIELIGVDVHIQDFAGKDGGIGLFSRYLYDPKPFLFYYLHSGDGVPENSSRVIFVKDMMDENYIQTNKKFNFDLAKTIRLTLRWDGSNLICSATDLEEQYEEVLISEPFDGYGNLFGIYFMIAGFSEIHGYVDNFVITYKE